MEEVDQRILEILKRASRPVKVGILTKILSSEGLSVTSIDVYGHLYGSLSDLVVTDENNRWSLR